ncbi:RDD family protein [Xylanimonas allomyrinae]|nr:RDD family protein [Xylanimonas allomyrinae]
MPESSTVATPPPYPVLDDSTQPYLPREAYAAWSRRVGAWFLDQAVLAGIVWLTLGERATVPTLTTGLFSDQDGQTPWQESGWVWLVFLGVLALQAWTGWTPGKLVAGIAVVRERDLRPAGLLRTILRVVCHMLDAILLIGYLRPLWEARRRTFADSIVGTVVVLRRPGLPAGPRRALTAGALVVCLAGAGLTVTTTSWGGPAAEATAWCIPAAASAGGDGDAARSASVELRGVRTQLVERRLWARRVTDVARSYSATWTWAEATTPVGDLQVELTATAPGGAVATQRVGVEGRSTASTTSETTSDGSHLTTQVPLDGDPATALGDVVDVTTSLLVDGQVVATCTVPGLRLEPVDR